MSLIGIDMGSSAVKAAAYSEDGRLLAVTSCNLTGRHPEPGLWEQDPEEVWQATSDAMRRLVASESVRQDPPRAIAVSASGRENFLADADLRPLAPAIMGADVRGAEFEIAPQGSSIPEPWCFSCGHARERMDPVFRLMWWRKYHPELVAKAKYFLGWHDFLVSRICGRIVTDRSSASRYLVYDLETNEWSTQRAAEYDLGPSLLPEVMPWPSIVGRIKKDVADAWGISPQVQVALGAHDVTCAALGAGVCEKGVACLISGSYEDLIVMTSSPPTAEMLLRGLSVMPHPGEAGYGALAVCPTGNAVLNWARGLCRVTIEAIESQLSVRSPAPSPVLAVPYLSGSMTYWEEGRKAKGSLVGLTLATSATDIVQAFMESIAYDHALTLSLLSQEGVKVNQIRAVGGGSRSVWWTQLKADIIGLPIEVVEQQEAGTLGAAILAGWALGIYDDLEAVSRSFSGVRRIHEPDYKRAELHRERLEAYKGLVSNLLATVYREWR